MKITNQTKSIILAEQAILAGTPFKRIKGLLGKKSLEKGQALILRPCTSIHTFFMGFALDVLFVNKDNRVVKAVSSIKPFRITGVYFSSSFAIELPAGTIQATGTSIGDTILIN